MAKKKKTEEEQPDESPVAIETPEAQAQPEYEIENAPEGTDAPREWAWPESRLKVALFVEFTDHELAELAQTMTRDVIESARIAAQKKASASHLQGQIDEIERRIANTAVDVQRNGKEKAIECEWQFECKLVDGELLSDLEHKTLFRLDTTEPVRSERITDEDRQACLALEHSPADEAASEDGAETEEEVA